MFKYLSKELPSNAKNNSITAAIVVALKAVLI